MGGLGPTGGRTPRTSNGPSIPPVNIRTAQLPTPRTLQAPQTPKKTAVSNIKTSPGNSKKTPTLNPKSQTTQALQAQIEAQEQEIESLESSTAATNLTEEELTVQATERGRLVGSDRVEFSRGFTGTANRDAIRVGKLQERADELQKLADARKLLSEKLKSANVGLSTELQHKKQEIKNLQDRFELASGQIIKTSAKNIKFC